MTFTASGLAVQLFPSMRTLDHWEAYIKSLITLQEPQLGFVLNCCRCHSTGLALLMSQLSDRVDQR